MRKIRMRDQRDCGRGHWRRTSRSHAASSALQGTCLLLLAASAARAGAGQQVQVNRVAEVPLVAARAYSNPFTDVDVDAVVTEPGGAQLRVPAFWAGGSRWVFRYASGRPGRVTWRTECSNTGDAGLHGARGTINVLAGAAGSPLYRHGPIRVAADRRHFEHADGTPFFWLGDTWWKGLCSRIPFDGFRKLAADRKAKGFTVVQIVAGPYPDEPPFDPRWANEGGMPYSPGYARLNPAYWRYADRRIECLVDSGLVPAIVGGWGWHMPSIGVEKMNRHWRNLIARYGAYPVVWIVGGEAGGPEWTAVARYLRKTDPFHRPATMHPHSSGRRAMTDDTVLDYDMLQTGHGGASLGTWQAAAANTVSKVMESYSKTPPMPVVVGEVVYEGHMQTNGPDAQRQVFWSSLLSGAAGHTYGAGGIWQMNSETTRGAEYEFTPWFEAMKLPGSTQLGLGKRLLERYPWWRFEPHPEWVEPHSAGLFEPHAEWQDDAKEFAARGGHWDRPYAAGIPGEVRVIYIPGHYYDWSAPTVKGLERDVPYHAFLFDPASGRRYGLGTVVNAGPPPRPFGGHAGPTLFADRFEGTDGSAWKDYGSPSRRAGGRLVGGKGMVTIVENLHGADLMASADARSDAEAGIILRFHDPDNYLVGLYSPLLKTIYLHDRKNGRWGEPLGRVDVPEVGPNIHLAVAAQGGRAAMVLTDGRLTYCTPIVRVSDVTDGRVGVWLFQVGERQEFGSFEVSRAELAPATSSRPARRPGEAPLVMHENPHIQPAVTLLERTLLPGDSYKLPRLPAPQDWVLVLERERKTH